MTDEAKRPMADGMEVPVSVQGHWETREGYDIAHRYAAMKSRSELIMGDKTDFALANEIYMADMPSIGLQTAVKDRIRWLSAHLAAAPAHPASEAVARLVEALKEIRFLWAGHSEECAHILSGFKEKCDCDWPKVRDKCDAALAPFLPKESNPHG